MFQIAENTKCIIFKCYQLNENSSQNTRFFIDTYECRQTISLTLSLLNRVTSNIKIKSKHQFGRVSIIEVTVKTTE